MSFDVLSGGGSEHRERFLPGRSGALAAPSGSSRGNRSSCSSQIAWWQVLQTWDPRSLGLMQTGPIQRPARTSPPEAQPSATLSASWVSRSNWFRTPHILLPLSLRIPSRATSPGIASFQPVEPNFSSASRNSLRGGGKNVASDCARVKLCQSLRTTAQSGTLSTQADFC